MSYEQLIDVAKVAQKKAYAPYSKFKVGAALITNSGTVYSGSNIENGSYSLTCCAERVVIFKAVSEGERNFSQMVIIGDTDEPISPCGACRQVMAEFFDHNVSIYLANMKGKIVKTSIAELLPYSFKLSNK